MHDDSSIGAFDLNADVSGELGSCRFCGCTQGDRHKRLWPIDQCALAMFAQPAVHDVGVDAVMQCHPSNGCSGLSAGCDNLQLDFRAVEPSLWSFGAWVVRVSLAMVCMMFIVHTIPGYQQSFNMCSPDAYVYGALTDKPIVAMIPAHC